MNFYVIFFLNNTSKIDTLIFDHRKFADTLRSIIPNYYAKKTHILHKNVYHVNEFFRAKQSLIKDLIQSYISLKLIPEKFLSNKAWRGTYIS